MESSKRSKRLEDCNMSEKLRKKIDKSIHRETYLLMNTMEKTVDNYLQDISFVAEANVLIRKMSETKELLDIEIVNEIYSGVVEKIKQI